MEQIVGAKMGRFFYVHMPPVVLIDHPGFVAQDIRSNVLPVALFIGGAK